MTKKQIRRALQSLLRGDLQARATIIRNCTNMESLGKRNPGTLLAKLEDAVRPKRAHTIAAFDRCISMIRDMLAGRIPLGPLPDVPLP